jgi:hypothetical protein
MKMCLRCGERVPRKSRRVTCIRCGRLICRRCSERDVRQCRADDGSPNGVPQDCAEERQRVDAVETRGVV